jgi:hypothetical protein
MTPRRFLIIVAIVATAIVGFVLMDTDCADKASEPVGAQHPVECKP